MRQELRRAPHEQRVQLHILALFLFGNPGTSLGGPIDCSNSSLNLHQPDLHGLKVPGRR